MAAAAPGPGAFFALILLLFSPPPPPLRAEEPATEPADTRDAAQARVRSAPAPVTDGGCPRGAAGHRRRSAAEGSRARGLPWAFRLWLPLPIAVPWDWHNRPASPGDLRGSLQRCSGAAGQLQPRLGASSERLSELLGTLMVAWTSHSRESHSPEGRWGWRAGSLSTAGSSGWPWMSSEGSTHTPSSLHTLPQGSARALWIHCHKNRARKVWLLCSDKVFPTV